MATPAKEAKGRSTLALLTSNPKDSRSTKTSVNKEGSNFTDSFVDAEGRAALATFVESALARVYGDEGAANLRWERPVNIVKPFRPVVHRNATPFVNPYAPAHQLHPLDSKEEEARARTRELFSSIGSVSNNSRRHSNDQTATAALNGCFFHDLYPEVVSAKEDLVGQDWSSWQRMGSAEAIRRYRMLSALIEPYDPTLIAGCAETPAEACGSRYSTALRHKLTHAEMLAALAHLPPFLMGAYNSALLTVQCSQHVVSSGHYLWELIYPHAPGTCHPVYNPFGKYAVKLFIKGAYRKVVVDDLLPVDVLGRPFLTVTARKELWPAILFKAIFKALHCCNEAGVLVASQSVMESPEVLLSYLIGNWVPQCLVPAQDPVECAALLLHWKHVTASRRPSVPMPIAEAKIMPLENTSRHPSFKRGSASTLFPRGGRRFKKKASDAAMGSNLSSTATLAGEVLPVANDAEDSTAKGEGDTASSMTGSDATCSIICGLRVSTPAYPHSSLFTQLYAITHIVPFRNTLAMCLVTTPRTVFAQQSVFEREPDAKDVREILLSNVFLERSKAESASTLTCWLTFEEFSDAFETLMVWRCFDQRYKYQAGPLTPALTAVATTTLPATTSAVSIPAKKQASVSSTLLATGAASAGDTQGSGGVDTASKTTTMIAWVSVSCSAPEEVALVTWSSVRGATAEAAQPSTVVGELNESPQTGHTSPDGKGTCIPTGKTAGVPADGVIQLESYHWGRADPLAHPMKLAYRTGTVSSLMLRLDVGHHVFRVTLPAMGLFDSVTFHSNAPLQLATELISLKDMNFNFLTDAGYYPAIERADEEFIWFKRILKVSTPTFVTAVLSTLLPTDDPSVHRRQYTAGSANAVMSSSMKATNAPRGAAVAHKAMTGGALGGAAPRAPPADDLDHRTGGISILTYTKLLLLNLDNGSHVNCGDKGRLVHQRLEPNQRGYLLLPYTFILQSEAAAVEAALEAPGEGVTESDASPIMTGGICSGNSQTTRLYGKGIWKLHLRSDNPLSSFEALRVDAVQKKEGGCLQRGGSTTLFCHTWTLTEPTHVSILMNLSLNYVMPFKLRVWSSAPNKESDEAPQGGASRPSLGVGMLSPLRESMVFESSKDFRTNEGPHLFVPNIFLDATTEKSKATTYFVEGVVSPEHVWEWNCFCRRFQALSFDQHRKKTEASVDRQVEEDLREIQEDEAGFIARKMKEQYLHRQQQQQQHHRATSEGITSARERSGIGSTVLRRRRSMDKKKLLCAFNSSRRGSTQQHALGAGADSSGALRDPLISLNGGGTKKECALHAVEGLDPSAEAFSIMYDLQLLFSSKVEVKTMYVAEDPHAAFMQHWRGFLMAGDHSTSHIHNSLHSSPVNTTLQTNSSSRFPTVSSSANACKTAGRHSRGEISSVLPEEHVTRSERATRNERGKVCRRHFCSNPLNIFLPRVLTIEEETVPSHSALSSGRDAAHLASSNTRRMALNANTGFVSSSNLAQQAAAITAANHTIVVSKADEEHDLCHVRPLTTDQYSIRLLPIRAQEVCAPTGSIETVAALTLPTTGSNIKETGKRLNRGGSSLYIKTMGCAALSFPLGIDEDSSYTDTEVATITKAIGALIQPTPAAVAESCLSLLDSLRETRSTTKTLMQSCYEKVEGDSERV